MTGENSNGGFGEITSGGYSNGLRWRDAPAEYGPHKTLYNRWKRWSDKGIFARMMAGLAAEHGEQKTVMIDATYLKAHRTATSMGVKKGGVDV
jgi:transposase